MEWLIEPFTLGFQQRALLAGILAAIGLAVIGTWVVIRGMTFLGDALVHGVIPGIALAVLLDINVLIGAAVAAALMVAGINFVHRQTRLSEDTGIGLLFVGMLGVGVILISRTDTFTGSLADILFGDALGVTDGDLITLAVIVAVVLASTAFLYRNFLVLSFNEQKAQLLGLDPRLGHLALLTLITLSIVGSFPVVGTLLVFGLMVGPAATASLLVRRVPAIMLTAAVIGALSVAVGLVVSYHADTSGSATIAVVPIALFFIVLTVRSVTGRTPAVAR
jgi:manganese/iron transport system permease protein